MALDGRILARARAVLAENRRLHEALYERRLEIAYERSPLIRAIDAEIRDSMTDLIKAALSPDEGNNIENIRLRNLELQEQRRVEMLRAGFPDHYLDDDYMCSICRDTGYSETNVCECLMELYIVELRDSLSSLLGIGDETFDSFELSYYDDAPSQDTGISPRRSMEIIYETCVEYARKFGKKSMNLFFNGSPGLGKTFLSACIARVVAESGHSVIYDTALSVFSKFEDAKFMKTDDPDEARAETRRYLACDLLILDDLGTEMSTAFTTSALYEIINTRLVAGRKTIISSNLSPSELHRRYSEHIMSRIFGEYHVLTFRGDDIRKKKNAI